MNLILLKVIQDESSSSISAKSSGSSFIPNIFSNSASFSSKVFLRCLTAPIANPASAGLSGSPSAIEANSFKNGIFQLGKYAPYPHRQIRIIFGIIFKCHLQKNEYSSGFISPLAWPFHENASLSNDRMFWQRAILRPCARSSSRSS